MNSPNERNANKPRYADLPGGSAHGLFGPEDVLGTLNWITDESVLRGAECVKSGAVFPLNWPINEPDPALFTRKVVEHTVFTTPSGNLDDRLDQFYPQGSSQWDGFLHVPDPELGFYNGLGTAEHGVHHWAERGIATRGVLLDVSFLFDNNEAQSLSERVEVGVEQLEKARQRSGLILQESDLLMIHTGWGDWFMGLERLERQVIRDKGIYPGLRACEDMFAYVWDHGISAIVSDTPGVEATPGPRPGNMHQRVLSRLGMPLGELWRLGKLVQHCRDDGVYECFVISAPMNLLGGVGSPANALALK